jgi:hypothetical protein
MKPAMHIAIQPVQWRGDRLRVSARVTGHPGWRLRRRNGVLFFEIPEAWSAAAIVQGKPSDLHDVFVRATIFSAMEARRTLVVHGRVSRSLLDNLEAYQETIHSWWPRYRPVEVKADAAVDAEADAAVDAEVEGPSQREAARRGQAVLGFTGGLDSIYSLYRHKRELAQENRQEIGACLFVHGFDIPAGDVGGFEAALRRVQRITDDVNVPLMSVRCNLRDRLPWWPHTHAAGVAAALSLFGARYSTGLIASSFSQYLLESEVAGRALGSTRWSDPLLSSDGFRIVHDEHKSRVEKTKILRDWEVARRCLRVCWEGKDHSANCGRCEKCVRQMLCMHAVGIDDFSAFPYGLTRNLILRPRGWIGRLLYYREKPVAWRECYQYAERSGLGQDEKIAVMKQALDQATGPGLQPVRRLSRLARTIVERVY